MKKCFLNRRTGLATTALMIGVFAATGLTNTQTMAQSAQKTQSGSAAKSMQSGSMDKGSAPKAHGSGGKSMMSTGLGLDGYCPVCIIAGKGWVKGDPNIQSTYDGKTYYFPSQEVKAAYDANPFKHTPVMNGDCIVCLKMLGKRVPGKVNFASMYQNRLFLFPDADTKKKFDVAPADFANADLAANGNCTVCTVEKNEQVAGLTEFTSLHKGLRYQFPGADQMKMFMANPTKYEVADPPAAK